MPARLASLDVDGTLVDSTYHHALAWQRATSRSRCGGSTARSASAATASGRTSRASGSSASKATRCASSRTTSAQSCCPRSSRSTAHTSCSPDPRAPLVVGDATWDCEAAHRAGMTPVGVLSGGFSRAELEEAGAGAVFEALRRLTAERTELPTARR